MAAWDLSSASYVGYYDYTVTGYTAYSTAWKPDGTKLYIQLHNLSTNVSYITEHNLSSAWDVSTASYSQAGLFGSSTSTYYMDLGANGTDAIAFDAVGDDVEAYSMSTAWDVSSMGTTRTGYYDPSEAGAVKMRFGDSGNKAYMFAYTGTEYVYQYSLSTAYDITTASYASKSGDASTVTNGSGFYVGNSGSSLYVADNGADVVHQFSLSTPWDISTLSYDSVTLDTNGTVDTPFDVSFSADGSYVYVLDNSGRVYQWSLVQTDLGLKFCGVSLSSLSKVIGADDSTFSKLIGATG